MKIENAAHFSGAASKVFETMVGTKVECGKAKVMNDGSPTADITGVVAFGGDLVGSMVLTFPEETARNVVKRFAMVEPDDITDPDFLDAIGELTNMVAGQAKSRFDMLDAGISVPTVVCGPYHHVNRQKNAPWVVVGASCEDGKFLLGMSITEKKL